MQEKEAFLIDRMWNVLIQSNNSQVYTTLGQLKRFIFVIEGLSPDQDTQDTKIKQKSQQSITEELKKIFSEYKPLYLNRMAKSKEIQQWQHDYDKNLTFKPVLSPKNDQILEQRKHSHQHRNKKEKIVVAEDNECTFKPNLVARQPRSSP